jgi:hypothetical protein
VISVDTVAVILTVALAVGGAYVGLSRSLAQLGERLARVEGIMEGWLNPPPKTTGDRSWDSFGGPPEEGACRR